MQYKVETIPHPLYGNQRFPMLVNSHNFGMPEPSAAIWGWELWLSSPFNTVSGRLGDLCVFYEFVSNELPTFFEDAAKLTLLTSRQINTLATFLLINFRYDIKDGVTVSPSTYNRRIDSIKLFLRSHYGRYIERLEDFEKAESFTKRLNGICNKIGKKRYSKADVENQTKYSLPLCPEEVDLLRLVVRPSTESFVNEVNPFRPQLQVRNACLILLLIEIGCRASELVLIQNNDRHLKLTTNPTVVIQDLNINDPSHRGRNDGASHKTRNRELPISRGLADLLIDYIEDHRPKLRRPFKGKLTEYLFVSEKDGGAMTTSGLDYVLETIFKNVPQLESAIHPHRLRVTKANEVRAGVDDDYKEKNSPMIKAGDMQDTLTTWGGWSSTSDMPKRYTNSHIQRNLNKYLAGKE
ncbi:MAG: tyrosine-type recombinase/integrase [Paraglaciecola polaris]|uniref:tyrosine-type recombinase/integrase n=1 Tax=Paraglaciecola polaris TaxID=222814 RepID=UPI00300172A2